MRRAWFEFFNYGKSQAPTRLIPQHNQARQVVEVAGIAHDEWARINRY